MQLAHRAALNGVQLDEIDPRIIIKSIEGSAGKDNTTAVGLGAGDGSRITGSRRESMEVAVRFSLNIRRDSLDKRNEVLEAVNAWAAQCGWLTVSYKKGRRLLVDEAVTPGEGDLWKRMTEYTITFRARSVPYWQEDTEVSVRTATGTSGSGRIRVAGSANTVCDALLENMSGARINTVNLTVDGKKMYFRNLQLEANESLSIGHTDKGILFIKIGSRSAMDKRTAADSVDDLTVAPGNVKFSFSAQRACRLTISARGRFR